MKAFVEMEYRGYEENPYEMVVGGSIRKGISKVLVFLDENMQIIKVSIPKDSTLDISGLKEKESYSVELDVKMTPIVKGTNVSQKQFQTYFQIINIMPFKLNNTSGGAAASSAPVVPVASHDNSKKNKEKEVF